MISAQDLIKNGETWTGTLNDILIGPLLTFTVHAYDASSKELYSGTTHQIITGTDDSVAVTLVPVDDGSSNVFPIITKIEKPQEIGKSKTASIKFYVEGSSGEQLNYQITGALNGGTFNPNSGSVTLNGATEILIITYEAPAIVGSYDHSITVINSQGNSVTSTFDTGVVKQAKNLGLVPLFNPVITGIDGQRSSNDLVFTAAVNDDGEQSELRFTFGFDSGLSFVDSTVNPAILQNYSETISGNLTLTVSDQSGNGGSTTVNYIIAEGQFPDVIIDNIIKPAYTVGDLSCPDWAQTDANWTCQTPRQSISNKIYASYYSFRGFCFDYGLEYISSTIESRQTFSGVYKNSTEGAWVTKNYSYHDPTAAITCGDIPRVTPSTAYKAVNEIVTTNTGITEIQAEWQDRTTYTEAVVACSNLGGRIPSLVELYYISGAQGETYTNCNTDGFNDFPPNPDSSLDLKVWSSGETGSTSSPTTITWWASGLCRGSESSASHSSKLEYICVK